MNIKGFGALRAYGASPVQEEALVARTTQDASEQLRIAKNSDHRLVLLNLALNKNLVDETVQELYNRDIDYLSRRLKNLGYREKNFFGF